MPYYQNRRGGRSLKFVGAAVRAAPYVARAARAAASVARKWNRVPPLTRRVAGGAAAVTAGTAATGYMVGRGRAQARPKYAKRINKSSTQMSSTLGDIKKTVKLGFSKPFDRRTLKLGFNHRVLRWQRCNTLNSGAAFPGALPLSHATVNTDQTKTPLFVMCLNSTANQSTEISTPAGFLLFNNTGGIVFDPQSTQNFDGTVTQAKWVMEQSSPDINAGDLDPEVRYIMNAWYDIRLNCYGANNQPTAYNIMIVSFEDDYLDIYETPSNSQEVADRHAVWQGMVHKYMSNPIMPMLNRKKKYKVHTQVDFTLQPTLNIENDTTPQNRVVRLFVKDGAMYDYSYHGDGLTNDDSLSTTRWRTQGNTSTADYGDFPAAKARKYLIVRALNTTRSATETPANTPSFDIIVRKSEYLQAR